MIKDTAERLVAIRGQYRGVNLTTIARKREKSLLKCISLPISPLERAGHTKDNEFKIREIIITYL